MFNDRRIENQYLINKVVDSNGDIIYVDDGLYSYKRKKWPKNRLTHYIRKKIYGNWIQQVEEIGIAEHISKTALFYPHNALTEFHKKKLYTHQSRELQICSSNFVGF